MTFKVVKRSGSVVPFSPDNINNMAIWAIKGNEKYVNWSDLVMLAMHQLPKDIVTTVQIQESLIKAALEMETPAYNRVAGRLLLGNMRKVVKVSRDFKEYYKFATESGLWRNMNWSEEDVEYFASLIDHERDLEYGYPTIRQFVDKFGRKDSGGNLCELPQYAFMGIAMSLFEGCSRKDVALYYKKASEQKINIPSPIMSGQRTPSNIGVSCVIATAGDSVQGIEALKHIMSIATASSAGLGIEYDVRSPRDDVRNGYAKAGGKLPHYKVAEFLTKELKQTNRGGSATTSFRVIDPEVMVLLGLKLPRSPEERRITQLDYSLLWNTSFLRKVAKKGKWPLVSIRECPELHEKFDANPDEYDSIVDRVLADDSVKKIVVDAWEIWETWINNRSETGRIYRTNLTHVNSHTPFKQKIRLSNLCQEVLLPTLPYEHITDLYKTTYEEGDGMTALCFLSAIDVARITSDKDYEDTAYIACKAVDQLIENMTYPFPQWEVTAKAYRSIGVGVTNLAYAVVKAGESYSNVEYLNKVAERHYYYLLKASTRLAKERGAFDWIHKTKWATGWLPIDTYCKNVDKLTTTVNYDWEALRVDVMYYGVRFSVVAAHMPCESSSVFASAVNSLYPPRAEMVMKDGSGGSYIQFFAPECDKYKYELAFDTEWNDIINMYALFQKWTDQTISADTWIDFTKYENSKVPLSVQTKNYLYADTMGVKTLYYSNHKTNRGEKEDVVVEEAPDCENCTF